MCFHKKKKMNLLPKENEIERLNTDQFYEEINNPTIQILTNQLVQRMSMINTANTSLWSSLLTSNSIFFAFFYFITNRHFFVSYLIISFLIILAIPMLIVLYLFIINKFINNENSKLEILTYNRICDYIKTKKEQKKSDEHARQESTCINWQRRWNFANKFLEPIAIFITIFSLIVCIIVFIISIDC